MGGMSKGMEDELLYDWYINNNLRKVCPKCSGQVIREIAYVQDGAGQGLLYRCQKCLYQYGVEDYSLRAYFDVAG